MSVDRYSGLLPPDRVTEPADLVVGYTTPLFARPGDRVTVHASTPADTFDLEVVRLRGVEGDGSVRADPAPWGGERRTLAGREQALDAGSCVVVAGVATAERFTARATILPTLFTERPQVVMG